MKRKYYLKLQENYFNQDKIKMIEKLKNGFEYSLILIKLYLKSLKTKGKLKIGFAILPEHSPYNIDQCLYIAKEIGIIKYLSNDEIMFNSIEIYQELGNKDKIEYFKNVLKYWNEKNIFLHKEEVYIKNILTSQKNIKNIYKQIYEIYSISEIEKAIDNYNIILKSKSYYWSHKWSLWDFLSRGLDRFVESAAPLENYKNEKVIVNEYETKYNKQYNNYLDKLR